MILAAAQMPASRRAISPYARRLARDRGVVLDALSGSGPFGRVVAADILAHLAKPVPATTASANVGQVSALGATIRLETLHRLLADLAGADSPFDLEDIVLRAAGCAVDDVPGVSSLAGGPVALEMRFEGTRAQVVFADIRGQSLAPLRRRRLALIAAATDQAGEPAALSLRLLAGGDIRPVAMPLLSGRAMRLVLAVDGEAECLLSFDAALVDEDAATAFLLRFKAYLEVPLRLLA